MVGSPRFLQESGVDMGPLDSAIQTLQAAGNTVVGVSRDATLIGLVALGDLIKSDAAATVDRLKFLGVTPVMLTGDNFRTAQAVAFAEIRAELLPGQKSAAIRELQQRGMRVMMVGDGINDAPALTQADVGMAMGVGTDIAIEAADIVIVGKKLEAAALAIEIGRNAYRKTVQNIALAFAFNGMGIPLAIVGWIRPWWPVLCCSTLS